VGFSKNVGTRLGLHDPDLTSPEHDRLMILLHENIDRYVHVALKDRKAIAELLCRGDTMDSSRPVTRASKPKWELPITRPGSTFIVGYLDLLAVVQIPVRYRYKRDGWRANPDDCWVEESGDADLHVCFEVKPTIPSAGEMLRQLNTYKSALVPQLDGRMVMGVFSPDTRFKEIIEDQGFFFVTPEDGASSDGEDQAGK
jgi:hypothetical protein